MTARAGSVSSRIRYRCQAGESSSHYASRRLIKFITSLPKKETDLTKSQVAVEALMLVWRSGATMLARIAVTEALNRHVERVFNPERKDTHWGKQKLKRDQ